MVGRKRQNDANNFIVKTNNIRKTDRTMASENYLEEALNAEVDETAVNAIMKSLEIQLCSTSSISNQEETPMSLLSSTVTSESEMNNTSQMQKCNVINKSYSAVGVPNEDMCKSSSTISPQNNSDNSKDLITVLPNSPSESQSSTCISQILTKHGQSDNVAKKPTENMKSIYLTGTQLSNCRAMFPPRSLPNNNLSFTLLPPQAGLQPASNEKDLNKAHSQSPTSVMVHIGKMSGVEHVKSDNKTLMIKCSASNATPGSPLLMNIVTTAMTTPSSVTITDTHATNINTSLGMSVTAASIPKTVASNITTPQMEGNAANAALSPGVQIVNVIPLHGTPGKQGQKNVAQRVVIGTPQVMGNRAGYQGKITHQAQQPPGRSTQGHLLIKNQNGQYSWVRVNFASRPGTTNATSSMSTTVGQSAIALTKANSSDITQVTQLPAVLPQNVKIQSVPNDIVAKEKCQRFLVKILELANTKNNTVKKNIYTLTQDLIDGKIDVEYFIHYLELLLNSKSQVSFTEFLRKSLPLIRHSLATKKFILDGIRPPAFPVSSPVAVVSNLSAPGSCSTVIQPTQQSILVQPPESGPGFKSRELLFWQPQAQLQGKVGSNNAYSKVEGVAQSHSSEYSNSTTQNVSLANRTFFSQSLIRPQVSAIRTTSSLSLQPQTSTLTSDFLKIPVSTSIQDIQQISPSLPSLQVNQTVVKIPDESYELMKPATQATTDVIMPTKRFASLQSTRPAVKNKKKKLYSLIDFTTEEINDVTSMCGVNLEEEARRTTKSTDRIGTQTISGKDKTFLNLDVLQHKIKDIASKYGLSEPSPQVANVLSQACEENIKNLLEKLSVIAAHRSTKLNLNLQHEILKDVKAQLKFLEEVDQIRQKQHEENECKLDANGHAKFRGKYKKPLRAEMVELRQQEANQTALHAIGFRKKPKLCDNSMTRNSEFLRDRNLNAIASAKSCLMVQTRPRIKRVSMHDLIFLLEQEKHTCRSVSLYKTYFKR